MLIGEVVLWNTSLTLTKRDCDSKKMASTFLGAYIQTRETSQSVTVSPLLGLCPCHSVRLSQSETAWKKKLSLTLYHIMCTRVFFRKNKKTCSLSLYLIHVYPNPAYVVHSSLQMTHKILDCGLWMITKMKERGSNGEQITKSPLPI